MSLNIICTNIAGYLIDKDEQPENLDVLAFGLEIIVSELLKLLLLLLVGIVLHKLIHYHNNCGF